MKLRVFFASDGDCLLLTSRDGRHALIDGGRSGTFKKETWPVLRAMAAANEAIDLIVVSHIDSDHISGILWLAHLVEEWVRFDHQTGAGNNPGFGKPGTPRPPEIKKLWHNSWRAQLSDLAGPIEAYLSRVGDSLELATVDRSRVPRAAVEAIEAVENLAESIPEGVELLETIEHKTPIPRNQKFVMLKSPLHVEKLGKTRLTVIGPGEKHLRRLREDWRKWLSTAAPDPAPAPPGNALGGFDFARERAEAEHLVSSLVEAATIIQDTDPDAVTPPNRASITLLAEEDGRTCLLTGDAGEPELIDGLKAAGRIVDGHFRCNVVKVQHHGATANLSIEFAGTVLADHYVFCADGNHHNPEPDVVKTLTETRSAEDPGRPFTLWFNCTPARTLETRRDAMKAAIDEARAAARRHPGITVKVLERRKPFFELTV